MKNFLFDLSTNDLVITPNQRLANTLQRNLETHHLSRNQHVYAAPTLISFAQLVKLLWKSYFFIAPQYLLNGDEEAWLWQKIINESDIHVDLLNTQQTSILAQTAWHHAKQWRLTLDAITFDQQNENTAIFAHWAKHFSQICQEKNLIDTSSALSAYCDNEKFLQSLPFKKIYFYHFIEFTPLQEHFIARLKNINKNIFLLHPASRNQNTSRMELNTAEDEMMAMARWAHQQYLQDKNKTIACVIPNLHHQRDTIVRNFKMVFESEAPPVDISAGYALSNFTIIQHTLLLMTLLEPFFDYEVFSTFLRSVYFQADEDSFYASDIIDAELRKHCKKTISLKEIHDILVVLNKNTASQSAKEICTTIETLNNFTSSYKNISQHSEAWLELLRQLGWPGQRNLNSTEYQVVKRFVALFSEIETFSYLQKEWSWKDFSSLLKTKCQNTIFQPESEKTSVQILGLLEASGMDFDSMWIMGLDDKTWPTASSPNPFLPYALQKKYLMPNASPEREYHYCKEMLQQLIQSSTNVIVSSAKHDADKPLSPSLLITAIEKITPTVDISSHSKQPLVTFESLSDTHAPHVTNEENIYGGTSIVQYQAQCPFKAFAALRLHATPLLQPVDTANALLRGQKIHHVLEYLWKTLKTSEKLLQLSENDLQHEIDQAILATYAKHEKNDTFLQSLEKLHLKKIIRSWLEVEKQRPAFTVIAIEDKREYRYKTITLRLRIDRIDQTSDNRNIIIDYKTGNPHIHHWLGKRLKEPQLPIYCISDTQSVDALCFAQIRQNDYCFKGISDNEDTLLTSFAKISPELREATWSTQKLAWKNNIHQLLDEFLEGHAIVDPLDATVCSRCHLTAFCRIFEYA